MLIDTHCHIYLAEFEDDRGDMISRAENEGIARFLLPAIDRLTHPAMLQVEKAFPNKCIAMMGLHPCSVKEDYKLELKAARDYFEERKFIAVGETGLDFYWDKTFTKEQYDAFHQQAEWALEFDLPLVIHSRNSIDECMAVVKQHQAGNLKGVFHCFSGSMEQALQIIDLGFYLGIGGVLTFKNAGLDKIIKEIDIKHIVLETDSPYLAPVPFRGKRNECSYMKYVVEKLSQVKEISKEEIESVTTANAQALFSI